MAFIGLIFASLTAVVIISAAGIMPIFIGTVLYRQTGHKKLGIVFRIIGYIMLIPSIGIGTVMAVLMFLKK